MIARESKRLFIIAGEASGDLHASRLLRALKADDPDLVISGWGGNLMRAEGAAILKDYKDLAFMGFIEVIANIRTIMANFRECKRQIREFLPDALILVDYPGFNLRMARYARKEGIKVFYYISPQVWAWKRSRVWSIRRNVDRLFVILPFEKEFYANYGIDVEYHGHPLCDILCDHPSGNPHPGKQIAILPGSRKQEVRRMLPVMLQASRDFPDYSFVIAGAPSLGEQFYKPLIGDYNVRLAFDQTYDILRNSEAAMVTSGTATLETALLGVPQVVCYKASPFSYVIARALVKVRFISLVNLVMDRFVVKELIQTDMSADLLSAELRKLVDDKQARQEMLSSYDDLRKNLGGPGVSEKVSDRIISLLQ